MRPWMLISNQQQQSMVEVLSSIPNNLLLLVADDGITLTGGKVSSWASQFGSFALLQNNATIRPTMSALNGRAVVRCSGAEWLDSAGHLFSSQSSAYSAFVVINPLVAASSQNQYASIAIDRTIRFHLRTSGATWGGFGGSEVNTTYTTSINTPVLLDICTSSGTGASASFSANGSLVGSGVNYGDSGLSRLTVGADVGYGRWIQADIGAIVVYDRLLSGSEQSTVRNQLMSYYSI